MTDRIEPGGSSDQNREDPLDLLTELATSVARTVLNDWLPNDLIPETPEFRMLERTRRILILSARHVPSIVDEVLEKAREHGGLKS